MNTEADVTQVDEYHGMGGSYILDVKTGKRQRVEETAPAAAPAPANPTPAESAAAAPATPAAQGSPRPALRRVPPPATSGE